MADQNTRGTDGSASELLATSGLLTMMGSVMAAVIAIVALGQGSLALAGLLGAVAVTSFAVSLGCFFSDSNSSDDTPLPFPSWLRTEPEAAAEMSAAG